MQTGQATVEQAKGERLNAVQWTNTTLDSHYASDTNLDVQYID